MVEGSRVLNDALPPFTTATFNSQRFASLHVRDQLVDLRTVKCALNAQHNRQRHHDIAVRQQQMTRRNIAVRDEGLDCLLAGEISMANSRACRRSSTGVTGSPSNSIRSAARPAGRRCPALGHYRLATGEQRILSVVVRRYCAPPHPQPVTLKPIPSYYPFLCVIDFYWHSCSWCCHLLISLTDQTKFHSNGQPVGLASADASSTAASAAAITSLPSVAHTFPRPYFFLPESSSI
jgi:hypothetical protein